MKMTYLDNGFWIIDDEDAKRLAGKLPRVGYEKLVVYDGKHYWLSSTLDWNRQRVWTIRDAKGWRLNERGEAVLGS